MPMKTHFEKVTLDEVKRIMELRAKLEANDDLPAEPIVIAVKEAEIKSAKAAQGKGVLR